MYLTSSRGGVATAFVGSVVLLALTERRWAATAALGASVAGAAVAVAVLLDRDELVNGPLGSDLVERQGRSAALLIGLACAATSVLYGFAERLLAGRIRMPSPAGRILVGIALVAIAVGVVAADPVGRFEEFKELPGASTGGDFVKAHLLSGSGSGRWQFWSAALDEWNENRLLGDGAGAYESWWAEHASFSYFVRDAHSLYLEVLGELGILGFALTLGLVIAGIFVGVRRSWRTPGERGVTTAAFTAVFTAYAFSMGFEWMWELTAVSLVGSTALALVSGPATAPLSQPRIADAEPTRGRVPGRGFGVAIAALAVVWALMWAQAIPFLANHEVTKSQNAMRRLDLHEAADAAEAARNIQPWAATPYLQLALVSERAGSLGRARAWIDKAIDRDHRNWRLWLVLARLETKLGQPAAAEASLRRAIELNPRSPLFEGLLDGAAGRLTEDLTDVSEPSLVPPAARRCRFPTCPRSSWPSVSVRPP